MFETGGGLQWSRPSILSAFREVCGLKPFSNSHFVNKIVYALFVGTTLWLGIFLIFLTPERLASLRGSTRTYLVIVAWPPARFAMGGIFLLIGIFFMLTTLRRLRKSNPDRPE